MSEFRLASPFSDHMVLQRDVPVPIWGLDRPGTRLVISSGGKSWHALADDGGRWKVDIGPFAVGTPFRIDIQGTEERALEDVLAGEVWLASGQSNMEWPLAAADGGEADIVIAEYPGMRLLTIPRNGTPEPVEFVENPGWQRCTPESAAPFSAVAYHFGRELHQELGVPVGLICNAWGGATMESYTRLDLLAEDPLLSAESLRIYKEYQRKCSAPGVMDAFNAAMNRWTDETGGRGYHGDPGDDGVARGWADRDYDDASWDVARIPEAIVPKLGEIDGAFWFRRPIELPGAWAGKELVLTLGIMDSADVAYVNGAEVGRTGSETPGYWSLKRAYVIPAGTMEPGRNVVTLRVFEQSWNGEIFHQTELMALAPRDGSASPVPLAGDWRYKVAIALPPKPVSPLPEKRDIPSMLYNGMVHPLVPFRFRGVIWYQGESNTSRWDQYRHLSGLMISDWRRRFGHGDFPFLLVQLAGFEADPVWLKLMLAQQECLDIPNTGMAVAADIGDAIDIHPRNKRDVGHRLALIARAMVYGQNVTCSGPTPEGASREGSSVRLRFGNVGSGLVSRSAGSGVNGFTMAGSDGVFEAAEARIDGIHVVLSSPHIAEPDRVRYAYRPFPECDLHNREGLPAPPFEFKLP